MGGFYTDPQGRVRPITGKKGGGGVVAVVVLVAALAAGGGLGGTASVSGAAGAAGAAGTTGSAGPGGLGGTGDAAGPAVGRSGPTGAARSREAARKGRYTEAWRRMGLKVVDQATGRSVTCVLHSYGQVREFFVRTPCRSLDRRLLALTDERGSTIMVSIAWVRMRDAGDGARLRRLIDSYGSGDVYPLASEVLHQYGIRFTGEHYHSRRSGPLVVIAEAEPAGGRPGTGLLDGAAEVAALFPPP